MHFWRFAPRKTFFVYREGTYWMLCALESCYGLHNVYNRKYYGLKPFSGVWTLKAHYLGQYFQLSFLLCISALNSAQIGLIERSGHRKWVDMALISFIMGNTMDWNRFMTFRRVKHSILINTVYFPFFLGFQPKFNPSRDVWQLSTLKMTI